MPCARHGCGGARLGDTLYVVGGGYAAPNREGTLPNPNPNPYP